MQAHYCALRINFLVTNGGLGNAFIASTTVSGLLLKSLVFALRLLSDKMQFYENCCHRLMHEQSSLWYCHCAPFTTSASRFAFSACNKQIMELILHKNSWLLLKLFKSRIFISLRCMWDSLLLRWLKIKLLLEWINDEKLFVRDMSWMAFC